MSKVSGKMRLLFCCLLVLSVSYFTYFNGYSKPAYAYYDEYYDIVDAEKSANRIASFDTNPPLGKMFIALGEKIINPNRDMGIRTQLEKGSVLFLTNNSGFSFTGVRFFPALFSLLDGLLIFLIFYRLSGRSLLSLMFSFLYLFENSSIVHLRAAMLDSTLIFFSLLTILYFVYLYDRKKEKIPLHYFILGCLTGFTVATKMVGLVLILLLFFLAFKYLKELKKLLKFSVSYFLGLCLIFLSVYYLHVALGSQILSADITDSKVSGGITGASEEYVRMAKNGEIYNPFKLFVPLRDHFRYISKVQAFMPREDSRKLGSNPIGWPLGIKSIKYATASAVDSDKFSYLEFRGNPINWALGLIAILFSICLVFTKNIFRIRISNVRIYDHIFVFISLYLGYMIFVTVVAATRVMYMHLYLFPLFLSFILFFLMFNYIFEEYIVRKDVVLNVSILLLAAQSFFAYTYASPTTYGSSINYLECEKIRLIDYWKDNCTDE